MRLVLYGRGVAVRTNDVKLGRVKRIATAAV